MNASHARPSIGRDRGFGRESASAALRRPRRYTLPASSSGSTARRASRPWSKGSIIKMNRSTSSSNYIEIAAEIVAAYVGNNAVPTDDLPILIDDVHRALLQVGQGEQAPQAEAPKPAVPVRRSVTPDYIICLDDGKRFKSLKRHLRTQYDMTPSQYREKWNLPSDYPMVAPNYARARSALAREIGLGQQRRSQASE